ncbi:MAG: protease HtpX [SAR202 cluster bacterium]|nr:protease HtpX [SAR202 cluster bacterium]
MNTVKTGFFMMLLGGLLLAVGYLMGGMGGIIVALIFAFVLNFAMYWFSDKIALRMAGAHEATPEAEPVLHSVVDEQVAKAGIPKPKVYIINNDSPNAFATGRSPKHASIAATTGIMRILNRDELGGVIAHELAHVGNRDTLIMTIVATVASALGMIAWMAQWSMIFGGFGGRDRDERGGGGGIIGIVGLLVIAILIPLITTIIRLAISRTREYQADATGARTSGTPEALASALEKLHIGSKRKPMEANTAVAHLFIVEPMHKGAMGFFNADSLMNLLSTHPPIAERVKRLRAVKEGW